MLHARKFTLCAGGIGIAQIVCNDQSEHRITEKLQRLVVKLTCGLLVSRRYLLVRPGAVSDRSFEQSTICEVISQNRFEEIEIGNRFGILQNALNYTRSMACERGGRYVPPLECDELLTRR